MLYVVNAEFHVIVILKCRYVVCRYVKCRGTLKGTFFLKNVIENIVVSISRNWGWLKINIVKFQLLNLKKISSYFMEISVLKGIL